MEPFSFRWKREPKWIPLSKAPTSSYRPKSCSLCSRFFCLSIERLIPVIISSAVDRIDSMHAFSSLVSLPDDQLLISAFLQKSVLQVDQRIDYEALLIICESDFRIEHLPHLHFTIIV